MIRNFLHIVRWPNLLLVAIIQGVIYQQLSLPANTVLDFLDFSLLCLVTIFISAYGYVINDYYDTHLDRINRPKKWIAGNEWSLKAVKRLYQGLVLFGGLLALILAIRLELELYFLIYPIAIFSLWLYSHALKCKPVVGNMWVALFCAGVVLIVALPDWILGNQHIIHANFLFYMTFAFLATFYREIIKDLEDAEGDGSMGCQTFIVRYGIKKGKVLAFIVALVLMGSLVWWDTIKNAASVGQILWLLQGAIIASMAFVWRAIDRVYFHYASTIMKLVMLGGTLIIFFS
jgi:4-hydroxybenzoate polyprenyltransferase